MSKLKNHETGCNDILAARTGLPVRDARLRITAWFRKSSIRSAIRVIILALCLSVPKVAIAQSEPSDAVPRGLFEIIFSGGIIGGSIIFVLLALSVTAAYLVFEHFLTIRKHEIIPEDLEQQVGERLKAGGIDQAEAACRENPSLLAYVLLQGFGEAHSGWPAVEKALEDALADQAARLLRKIEYLSVIGNIAPMIGLLGTVTGMIFAFQKVATTQGAAGAGELAEGIYQALVTTVGGLLVAIPSLAAFAVLRNRVDQLVAGSGRRHSSSCAGHCVVVRCRGPDHRRSVEGHPMKLPSRSTRSLVGFNMTPMIDVVFLLINFLSCLESSSSA